MKVVLDANLIISAFLVSDSVSSKVLDKVLDEHSIIASPSVLNEIRQKLPDEKFDRYLDLTTRMALFVKLENQVLPVNVVYTVSACRDPKDNKYLELALSGKADCIITGDKDLLVLNPFEGIPIITPRNFIDQY